MTIPALVPEPRDPLAVALGNASLLGAGYFLLGRRRLAVLTGLVTVVLVVLHAAAFRSGWSGAALLLWWAAQIAHGFLLARRNGQPDGVAGQRLAALAVTVPVLLAGTFLWFDTASIEQEVARAQRGGDCGRARTALDRVWAGHRVVDAPATVRGERTAEACKRLQRADRELTRGLTGDNAGLTAGFTILGSVLRDLPGHRRMVEVTLDGFLARLPATDDACTTAAITDWLRDRPATDDALNRSAGAIARTAPAALTGCADSLLAARNWLQARDRYRQLLKQYPGDPHTGRAKAGLRRATLAIELANVRTLLAGSAATQPRYCSDPAKYSGAPAYRKGTNRALFYGNEDYTRQLPAGWRASDPARAVLVVCAEDTDYGTAVRTCPYESKGGLRNFPTYVTFHQAAIRVKVYELRTGRRVADRTIQVGGSACPRRLTYTTFLNSDFGPPSQVYVKTSRARVRAAFQPLVVR